MAQTAPPQAKKENQKKDSQPAKQSQTPPDDAFWERYSPHHEFPLSSVGSFTLHILILGIAFLFYILSGYFFGNANRSLPVEAVRLNLGGGGGSTNGDNNGNNDGNLPQEADTAKDQTQAAKPAEDVPTPKLDMNATPKLDPHFDNDSQRFIAQTNTAAAQSFAKLSKVSSKIKLSDGSGRDKGKGGTGSGGGSGGGTGTGVGNDRGEGQGTLSQRERRMLRWSLNLDKSGGPAYVSQLHGLGAILAIPIREDGTNTEFKIVRNLAGRPPKLLDEDINKIDRIYWYDENPRSVADVMEVLRLPMRPNYFIALMPEELEKKLFKLEADYLNKHHRGKQENDIAETKFRLLPRSGGKFEPQVLSMKLNK